MIYELETKAWFAHHRYILGEHPVHPGDPVILLVAAMGTDVQQESQVDGQARETALFGQQGKQAQGQTCQVPRLRTAV